MRDNPVIRREGFEIVGTQYGGWLVMEPRRHYGDERRDDLYFHPFVAAFTTFDDLLAWLGKQSRHDNMPSGAQSPEKT